MGLPQIILLALWGISLGVAIAQHGQPKKGTESAWNSIIGLAIVAPILYWGGFFHG